MPSVKKAIKTYSLDMDILADVRRTKGAASESERVNQLLRAALDLERKALQEQEAADFFATAPKGRSERRAFQKATLTALKRA